MTALAIRRDKSIGYLTSFLFHAAFLITGSLLFVKPVEYAVNAGSGGIEISLTAAPAEEAAIMPSVIQEAPKAAEEKVLPREPEDISLPQHKIEEVLITPAAAVKALPKLAQTTVNSLDKGDGSSAVLGKDATTFYSAGGALTEAKPNYLKNPAPPYPYEARKNKWRGIVILKVAVDKMGRPAQVEKEQGSGFSVLDESALKTVKTWRFQPARLGSLPVESSVRVPIRFELESSKKA